MTAEEYRIRLRPGDRNGPTLTKEGQLFLVAGRHADGVPWKRYATQLEVSLFQALHRARLQIKRLRGRLNE